ncbi:MAG: Hpt domain-containing protein [Gammaproteobacteria bacterium]|nr:Hpt domain-containing protein [Gammaproteobacteria bacterium]
MDQVPRPSFGQLSPGGRERLQQIEARMRAEIPSNLQRLRDLHHAVVMAPAASRCHARRDLAAAAHRLRGRAGMLQLDRLCDAAAQLESDAATDAGPAILSAAVASCEQAWQDAEPC